MTQDQFTKYENKSNYFDFYTSSGEFNLALFNQKFRDEQIKRLSFYRNEERKRLDKLNELVPAQPKLHELTIGQHLLNMKNSNFNLMEDLMTKPFEISLLTKDNRLFYLSLLILIIYIIHVTIHNLSN